MNNLNNNELVNEDGKTLEDLIKEYRTVEVEDNWWYENIIEDWTEKLEDLGYTDPEIFFSGFWSQGDGAGFTSRFDIDKFINNNKPLIIQWLFPQITDGIDDLKNCLSIYVKHTGGNCCHENCFRVNVDIECDPDYIEDDKFEDIAQQLEKILEDERESLSRQPINRQSNIKELYIMGGKGSGNRTGKQTGRIKTYQDERKQATIRIDPDLWDEFLTKCRRNKTTGNEVAAQLIADWVEAGIPGM